jgi:hypothetical protein
MHSTGISSFMCQPTRGEQSVYWTFLETQCRWACIYWCIVVCPMSSQSSRGEGVQVRLLCNISNDPWHSLYLISRGWHYWI